MENQENQNVFTEMNPEEALQDVPQQEVETTVPAEDGFYHGNGAGQREIPFASTGMPGIEEPQPVAQPAQAPKKKGAVLRQVLASVMILSIILAACSVTATVVLNQVVDYYDQQMNVLKLYFDEKIAILQQRVDKLEGMGEGVGPLEKPEGNLTAGQIYEQNIQSVVAITCKTTMVNNFGQVYQATSSGSGFVMTEDGYIVTNHHVISDATEIIVSFEDGTQYPAKLVGSNASSDIAMLKVDATGFRPVTIGKSSNLAVGDQVVVIGNALGELSFSLTVGYVSGMDRNVTTDGSVMNMLQTDAAINSGNSGGPMFNARGEVIGINTAKYSGTTTSGASIEGIGFAIPMDDVLGMLEDLRDFGYIKGASMGVYVTNVDSATAEMYNLPLGVYIKEVIADSAAQKAGIQAKDIVVELGGYEIKNMNDLTRALRHFEGGQTATVTVWRSGVEMILTITFDEKTE